MNDNRQETDVIGRAIDEIELILMDCFNEDKFRTNRAMSQIIPVVGQLIRDVMQDTAKSIMKVIDSVKEME